MSVKTTLFNKERFFDPFKWSVVFIALYLLLKLLGVVFLVPIVALLIMFFSSSTLLLSFVKGKWNIVSMLVLSIGVSLLFKTLVLFLLLSNYVVNYDWKLWLATELVLLVVIRLVLALFKKKPEIEIEIREGDVLAIVAMGILFVVLVINANRYFLIPSADPYSFKNITDYILETGTYPKGFEPYTYYAYYANYEPLYPVLMLAFVISTGLSSFFVYKYVALIIPVLSMLVFFWSVRYWLGKFSGKKIAIILLLVFLSFPHYMTESVVSRPWVMLFYFFPILAAFVGQRGASFKSLVVIWMIVFTLSMVHIFYVLLIPSALVGSAWFLLPRLKDKRNLLILFLVLIILLMGMERFGAMTRVMWALSLVKFSGFSFSGFYSIRDYVYYLGVLIPLFSLIGLFRIVKDRNIELLKKYSSFGVIVFLSIVVNEVFSRFGVKIVNERFMMFLGLGLIPVAVYGLILTLESVKQKKLWMYFVPAMIVVSLLVMVYVVGKNSLGWVSKNEMESIRLVESIIEPGSIVLTQPNNVPLIRYGLPRRFLVSNLKKDRWDRIFFGLDDTQRIEALSVMGDVGFAKLYLAVDDIKSGVVKDFYDLENKSENKEDLLDDINAWLGYYNRLVDSDYKVCSPIKFIKNDDMDDSEMLSVLLERFNQIVACCDFVKRLDDRVGNLSESDFYIVYSFDRGKTAYVGQKWWDETSYNDANLGMFERRKDCFEEVFRNKTLVVWKFKDCLSF